MPLKNEQVVHKLRNESKVLAALLIMFTSFQNSGRLL